jgi:Double-GTPase 2
VTAVVDVTPEAEGSCRNADCLFNQDGTCALGEEPIECEYFEPIPTEETPAEIGTPTTIPLPSGEALSSEDLEQILADEAASYVVPLGLVKAGKTTLMCLLFDQLRTRRLEPWRFTKSRTVIGFARRSHESSFRSGRNVGDTRRTSLLESGLHLHIGVRDELGRSRPLLISDLSGEHVRRLTNGTVEPVMARAIARANHLPIIVNGRDIANPNRRNGAIYSARALIGGVARQPRRSDVQMSVVVTKGDLLADVEMDSIFDEITRETIAAGAPTFVTADRDSAQSKDGVAVVERGRGLLGLVAHVTVTPEREAGRWPEVDPQKPSPVLAHMWGLQ